MIRIFTNNWKIKNIFLKKTKKYNFSENIKNLKDSKYYSEKLIKSTTDLILKKSLKKMHKIVIKKDEKNLKKEIKNNMGNFLRLYSFGKKIDNLINLYNLLNFQRSDFTKEKLILGKKILLKLKNEEIKNEETIVFLENFFEFILKNSENLEIKENIKDIDFYEIFKNFMNSFESLNFKNIDLYLEQFFLILKYMIIFEKKLGFILKRGSMMEISYKFENIFLEKKNIVIKKNLFLLEILNCFQFLSILTSSKEMDNLFIHLFKKIDFNKLDNEKKKDFVFEFLNYFSFYSHIDNKKLNLIKNLICFENLDFDDKIKFLRYFILGNFDKNIFNEKIEINILSIIENVFNNFEIIKKHTFNLSSLHMIYLFFKNNQDFLILKKKFKNEISFLNFICILKKDFHISRKQKEKIYEIIKRNNLQINSCVHYNESLLNNFFHLDFNPKRESENKFHLIEKKLKNSFSKYFPKIFKDFKINLKSEQFICLYNVDFLLTMENLKKKTNSEIKKNELISEKEKIPKDDDNLINRKNFEKLKIVIEFSGFSYTNKDDQITNYQKLKNEIIKDHGYVLLRVFSDDDMLALLNLNDFEKISKIFAFGIQNELKNQRNIDVNLNYD